MRKVISVIAITVTIIIVIAPAVVRVWWQLEKVYYAVIDIPAITKEASKIPGVGISKVVDDGPYDETNFHFFFVIEGKGDFVLRTPYLHSFSGQGPLILVSIGDCSLSATDIRNLVKDSNLGEVTTVEAIVNSYSKLYEFLKNKGECR